MNERPKKAEFQFTVRQMQIAKLIAAGVSRKIMCDKLKIKMSSLSRHLELIRAKIHADSLYQAASILSRYF